MFVQPQTVVTLKTVFKQSPFLQLIGSNKSFHE